MAQSGGSATSQKGESTSGRPLGKWENAAKEASKRRGTGIFPVLFDRRIAGLFPSWLLGDVGTRRQQGQHPRTRRPLLLFLASNPIVHAWMLCLDPPAVSTTHLSSAPRLLTGCGGTSLILICLMGTRAASARAVLSGPRDPCRISFFFLFGRVHPLDLSSANSSDK